MILLILKYNEIRLKIFSKEEPSCYFERFHKNAKLIKLFCIFAVNDAFNSDKEKVF